MSAAGDFRGQTDGYRTTIARGESKGILQNRIGDARQPITVCLTRRDDDTPNKIGDDDIDAPIIGEANYGTVYGLEERVQFDWLNGMLICFPTGNVSLNAIYPATVNGVIPSVSLQQLVGCIVCDGLRPPAAGGLSQARLTSNLGEVVTTTTTLVPVPNRAHAVRLLTRRPDLYGSFRLGFSPSMKIGHETSFNDPTEADELPLSAGTRMVSVQNNAAVDVRLSLIWSLSL